jgi:hypothetical protein
MSSLIVKTDDGVKVREFFRFEVGGRYVGVF